RAQRHLLPTALPPQQGAALAAPLPAWQGSRRTVSAGTQGPMADACARPRVTLGQDGLPERPGGGGSQPPCPSAPAPPPGISRAPAGLPCRPLVGLAAIRWAVEPGWEAGNRALGMAH